MAVVRNRADALELSGRMVTELIEHIDVYHAEKAGPETTQKIMMPYNCIGTFNVPDWEHIPDMDILQEKRKGVAIRYWQGRLAEQEALFNLHVKTQ